MNNQKRQVLGHSNRKSCILLPEGDRPTSRNTFFLVQDPSSPNLSVTCNRQNSFELTGNKHSPQENQLVARETLDRQICLMWSLLFRCDKTLTVNCSFCLYRTSRFDPVPLLTILSKTHPIETNRRYSPDSGASYMSCHTQFLIHVLTELLIINTTEYIYIITPSTIFAEQWFCE